jgi:hypothetical protein
MDRCSDLADFSLLSEEIHVNRYLKAIVAVLGAAVTVGQTVWPANHWQQAVTAGITAALVYLVPNSPKSGG